ncbi:MAG: AAA family ATPase [Sulfurovum sp.]
MATINLSNKNLKHCPDIAPNATDIRINNNQLTEIPDSIGELSNLKILILSNNSIKKITPKIENLSNLTHLDLGNNPIEYLPHSIKKLKKLRHLGLTGTKLPLPPNYNPAQNIQSTIDYILENQKEPLPELNIKNAYIYFNLSKDFLIKSFTNTIEKFSKEYEVSFTDIKDAKEINRDTTMVLIIVSYDIHLNSQMIFRIIKRCIALKISHKILFQKDTFYGEEGINLEKGLEVSELRRTIEKDYKSALLPFNSINEFTGLTLSILKEHKPEVVLVSLQLRNIGHFKEVTMNFNEDVTCIVGENGRGKSSILKALSLAITGSKNSKIEKNVLYNLLRIKSITQSGGTNYCDSGVIVLNYKIDSVAYQNIVKLTTKDEGRVIDVEFLGDLQLNVGEYNLKSLIVGFPQLRGKINQDEKIGKSAYTQPHIDDLLPLLNDNDDKRLDSFVRWVANLYGEALKANNIDNSREYSIIKYVFEIISKLTGKELVFMHIQQFSPPIVIISTPESPNGISLNLISQGFKIVIGWIGYFVQRRLEAFPLSSPTNNSREKSILIIDEIDSSIHPIWQSRLLKVLRECFPTTQIICTTHSPLMLAGLDREQILEVKKDESNQIIVKNNDFDTWATSYKEILKTIFRTSDFVPTVTVKELERKLDLSTNDEERKRIQISLDRLLENQIHTDHLKEYEERLKRKEEELDSIIEVYRKKSK